MGVKGSFKNLETSRRSLTGVLSLIGSRAIIRRPEDDLGFSVISEDEGAKRPLWQIRDLVGWIEKYVLL